MALIFVLTNLNLPELAKTCQGMENILEIVKAAPSKFGSGVGHRVRVWAKVDKSWLKWANFGKKCCPVWPSLAHVGQIWAKMG